MLLSTCSTVSPCPTRATDASVCLPRSPVSPSPHAQLTRDLRVSSIDRCTTQAPKGFSIADYLPQLGGLVSPVETAKETREVAPSAPAAAWCVPWVTGCAFSA